MSSAIEIFENAVGTQKRGRMTGLTIDLAERQVCTAVILFVRGASQFPRLRAQVGLLCIRTGITPSTSLLLTSSLPASNSALRFSAFAGVYNAGSEHIEFNDLRWRFVIELCVVRFTIEFRSFAVGI
jgi:hypothetical protein